MGYIVETKHLTKAFNKHKAVENVHLNIQKGDIYGFLGPNGAGKSTTIRMLLGLTYPTSGDIRIFGQDLKQNRIKILHHVGSLVENPSYYPHLTAYENLEVVRKVLQVPKERISAVLQLVRLKHVADKKVKGFSLGMKQRLGIAAALLHQPKLLILDEPTNGLDPEGIIEIRTLMKNLANQGITILVSSHMLSEIEQVATTIGVIVKGKLIYQNNMSELRKLAKSRIRLRVSDMFQAQKLIRGMVKDEWLYTKSQTDQEVAQLIAKLVQHDISIYRVEEEKRSLESIYLQMVNGANKQ
ncbi:MAG TPA: ABC transporter ATP-binding protein [Cerasibacillus sp.]|uniref:ABC transporter ATP-binding protein n=1 Tax=Cerasibacillus sp. TaxID=2498711 RepID=UPI002F4126FC